MYSYLLMSALRESVMHFLIYTTSASHIAVSVVGEDVKDEYVNSVLECE